MRGLRVVKFQQFVRWPKSCIVTIVLSTLVGCQTVEPTGGKGPIFLSHSVVTSFEAYKSFSRPTYFAVSSDGRISSSTSCPIHFSGCVDDSGDSALRSCNQRAERLGRKPCALFASERDIVWQGDIQIPTLSQDFYLAFVRGGWSRSIGFGTGRFEN